MFEEMITWDNRSLREDVLYPSKSWFNEDRYEMYDKRDYKTYIDRCEESLVVTHNDADGLVSGALFKNGLNEEVEVVPVSYDHIEFVFDYLSNNTKDIKNVYVSDLNLDEVYECIEDIANNVEEFKWFDHHEWGEKKEKVEEMGVDITIDNEFEDDKCGARLVYEYLENNFGGEYYGTNDNSVCSPAGGMVYNSCLDKNTREIVYLTEDRDLWIKEAEPITIGGETMPLSDVLSTIAFFSEDEKFMDNILDYGEDFIDNYHNLLRDRYEDDFLERKIENDRTKREIVKDNFLTIKDIKGYKVGFAYGRVSPGDIFEEIREENEKIDIFALVKPQGKISLRSSEEFMYCHEVAENLGGGGHEQAAGCFPETISSLDDLMVNISNKGEKLHNDIEEAIEEVIEENNLEKSLKNRVLSGPIELMKVTIKGKIF